MSDIDEAAIRGRVAALIDNLGGPSAAARIVGMSREQLGKWRSGETRLPLLPIAEMCEQADTSLDWVVFGPLFQSSLSAKAAGTPRNDVIRLPVYNVQASAGSGRVNEAPAIVQRLPIAKAVLDELSVREGKAHFIRARGDSMEPTIKSGSLVLIDTSYDQVKDDGIYALIVGEDVRIKRVAKGWQGALQLLSDNDRYQMEQLAAPDAEALRIAGKVVWAGGKI